VQSIPSGHVDCVALLIVGARHFSDPEPDTHDPSRPDRVSGNSARSVLSEATLNAWGTGRFQAFSAGSQPTGRIDPFAIAQLQASGIAVDGLRSKS